VIESFADFALFHMHNGIAVGFLIASVGERIQGERVIFRRGDFFFDESTEDASFDGCQCELHGFLPVGTFRETAASEKKS
jgi:hypothetical protein